MRPPGPPPRPAPSRSPVAYRRPPPPRRTMAGPLVFVLLILALVVVMVGQGQTIVGDAIVSLASERETLLRQGPIRALVASRLGAAMTPREIAEELVRRAPEDQTTLRIIEGWRLTEIAAEVSKVFPQITKEAFTQTAVVGKRTSSVLARLDPAMSLDGWLFPDTYFFRKDATAEKIVSTLLETFETKAGPALRVGAAEQKRTVYDLVKLASVVEREARDRKESAQIAGVYANRLKVGMKLDADPTIQYALGTWRELLLEDLKIDSPYNTYKVAGLPPTPIASPGLAAIEGAAKPAEHDFLFFVAKGDASGQHLFARTLEEHEANRVKVGNR